MGKQIYTIYAKLFCLTGPMHVAMFSWLPGLNHNFSRGKSILLKKDAVPGEFRTGDPSSQVQPSKSELLLSSADSSSCTLFAYACLTQLPYCQLTRIQPLFVVLKMLSALMSAAYLHLSYDIPSESDITPCIQIDKPLVVYRFSGNVMK